MRLLKTIIVVTAIVVWGSGLSIVNSEEVSREQARQIAVSWMAEKTGVAGQGLHENQLDNLVCTGIERDFRTIAYLFEKPEGGFVLVAGDDKVGPIIAYSEANKFDRSIPPVKRFLDVVYDVMGEGNISTEQENIHSLGQVKSTAVGKVGPLLKTQWSQGPPYNKYCPTTYYLWPHSAHTYCIECTVDTDYGVGYTAVGCVAVAMGQIMRYHRQPARGIGDHEYVWEHITCCPASGCGATGKCPGADEGLYANFEVNYDWANMPASLTTSSPQAQIDAVSRLLYHCGVAVEMDYGCSLCGGSGAYSVDVRDVLRRYFDYESSAEYIGRDFDSPQWFSMLSEEITNNRPVYYDGRWSGGHAFILDGVDDTSGDQLFVHLNYGWGVGSDAWYDMGLFLPFCLDHHVVLGICPRNGSAGGVSGQPNAPTSPGGPGASGGGCFIATAAYGSGLANEVRVLSDFRDRYLVTNILGKCFVGAYYRVGPSIAGFISEKPLIKSLVRMQLKPWVKIAKIVISG